MLSCPALCLQDTTSPWSTAYGKENSDTNACNERFWEKKEKRNEETEKEKKKGNEKHESGVTLKWPFPSSSLPPPPRPKIYNVLMTRADGT